jgi:hypothetical protein
MHRSDLRPDRLLRPAQQQSLAAFVSHGLVQSQPDSGGCRVLVGDRAVHSSREPLRPFDPQESGWADLIRTEMDSWLPGRLPVHFERAGSGPRQSGGTGRAQFALMGAVVALAAAVTLFGRSRRRGRSDVRSLGGRGWHSGRRGVGRRNWGGN